MDNQYKQKIDTGEPDEKPRLTKDVVGSVNKDLQKVDLGGVQIPFSPARFLIIIIGGIFLAEVIAMIFIYRLPHLPYYQQVLIDASIMVLLIFPLIYYFSLRPLLLHIENHNRLENALRQSEERFALAYRSNPAALSIVRVADGNFVEVNDSFLRQSGYARNEVIGHTSEELNLYPNHEEQENLKWLLLKQKSVDNFEMTTRIKSGEFRNVSVSTEAIELDGEVNILAVASDITERKQAAELVERERQRFYDVLESLPAYLVLLTPDYRVSFANRFYRERFGESQGRRCYEYLFGRNEPCETCKTYKVLNTRMPERWEWNGPDNYIYDVSNYPFSDVDGSTLILQIGIDITEKKQAEARLERVNHALSVLKECNEILLRVENEAELLQQMCEIIVSIGEYRMAWVGFAEQDEDKSVRPAAQFGFEDGYLGLAQITWADNEHGHGPTGTAIREGVTQVNQNFQTNPKTEPWRASALSRGYQSSIALPLKDEGSTFGALTIYSASPDAFDEDEVNLLNELAGDLAFGITALRVRVERNRVQEQIREMALFPALNPDAVLQVDASGRIKKTNPAAVHLGLCEGAQLTEILPDLLDLDLPACIAAGGTQQVQLEARLGEQVLLCTVRGVPDLGLAFLYGKDITHRKRAEAEIRQLSSIVEQTEDTVVVTNPMGVVEYVNPAFERLTGYTKEEALGKTPSILKSGIHDEQFYEKLWNTILDGSFFQGEITNRRKNGELFYEVKTITPLRDSQGQITHFVATGKDITTHKLDEEKLRKAYEELELRVKERTMELRLANLELAEEIRVRQHVEVALRQNEQQLSRAQEIAHLGSWELDLEIDRLTWSDEVYRIFGFQPQEFGATYEAFLEAIHPNDRAAVDAAYSDSIAEGRDHYEIEHRVVRRPNGEVRIVHEKCEHYKNEAGQIIRSVGMVQDITERKQVEGVLRRNESLLHQTGEMAKVGGWELDLQTKQLVWTLETYKIHEVDPSFQPELEGALNFYAPEVRPQIAEAVHWAIEEGQSYDLELPFITAKGRNIWIRTIGQAEFRDGRCARLFGAFQDITERKQAEQNQHRLTETLAQRVAELQTLMDVAPVGIAIGHDPEGQVITVNRLLSEWLSAPSGANVSLSTPEEERQVTYQVLREGRPARVEELPIQYAALNALGVRNDEFSIVRSDGRIIEMLANAEPLFNDQGHVRGSIATYIDITQRKRAEEHVTYQARLLASVNDAIVGSDPQFRLNAWNASAESMYGWKAEEVLGRNGVELLRTEWPQEDADVMRRTIAETGRWRGVATQLRKDGTRIPVEVSSIVLRNVDGQITGFVSVNRDITERRRAEDELRKAHDELELRVHERTKELAAVNTALVKEIAERREVERQLRIQTTAMEAAANGIIITDPKGIIQWTNPALTQITGYEAGELLGQSTRVFNSGKQDAAYYSQMWNTIFAGQIWRGETINRRKDNSLYVEEQTITPVRDERDQIQHFIAIKQDITERKQAELELAKRNVELQALSAAEREQRQLSEALVEAALVLNKSMKLDEVLTLILEKIKEVIPYQLANVAMLDGTSFYDASHQGDLRWSKALAGMKNRFPLEDFRLLMKMCQSGQPLLIKDIHNEPEWVSANGLEWCRSYLSAPLLAENQVMGFINLFAERPGFFTTEMQDRLVAFASHAAVAIQNAWLFEQVRASNDRLQSLSRRLVEIQENERLYIARELHDEAGQMLTSLMLDLRTLETQAHQPEEIFKKIAEMEVSLNAVSESLHSVAMALRPASLDHLGLVPALRQYVESVGEKYGLKTSFRSGKFHERLPANMETELYRIVQEALTNVVRHAHASRADVILTIRNNKLIVIVEDDGDGFNPQSVAENGHLGLFGIRERADMIGGKLLIESAPGKGTTLIVEVIYADSIVDRG